ncbi:MAG: RagB/SusD family nutrient uptake outer membrane protein [Saprospiraceae bacterium]|nr:RagB/SusD family nutrient uptake outer membrane protein [Saprospiraceae bacterium]
MSLYSKKLQAFLCCLSLLLLFSACKDLNTVNLNNPDRETVLSTGGDLITALAGGYVNWWKGIHGNHPNVSLGVAADAYGMSWADFGAQRMGMEPRTSYNNRATEEIDYRKVVQEPWFACLSAVATANDILEALDRGITIDQGGPQDQGIRAAAHFLRGVSWGYLGLIFDQGLLVAEKANLEAALDYKNYQEMIAAAVAELEMAIQITSPLGEDFVHQYFNGVRLDVPKFNELSHAYAARFLAQWPRTPTENEQVDWQVVFNHAEKGLSFDFAPLADGNAWQSYHQWVFAETGQGPFWARVDQRLVAAMDPNQPNRYPEVFAQGEPALTNTEAQSKDKRLETDFTYLMKHNFPTDRGEWHFSHYKHNRNLSDPDFAGDGSSTGPMPAFRKADNELLRIEALLALDRTSEALQALNAGTRSSRGQLTALSAQTTQAGIKTAIVYERAIELLGTAPLGLWFDRRRMAPREDYLQVTPLGGLQFGTPAHLPVPAEELRIQGEPPYSFGGETDPEGISPVY